ncbi:hypothetical protein WNY78_00450 [Psychroserpens sp. AS72]|uniref:hypothetical protein n=1 Tax=Psychroserpens sp. AS72 TaxID=3135775 RepID=UPI00316B8DE9
MKKHYNFILVFFCVSLCLAQNVEESARSESNPIIYGNFMIGVGGSSNEVSGLTLGFDVNYQINKDLFTFRTTYIAEENREAGFAAILIFPRYTGGDSMNEFALLYGKRFVFSGSALSLSAGLSTNLLKYSHYVDGDKIRFRKSHMAIPFELNFNIFKARKKRIRVFYGIIPVGQPTSFGRSFGVKLFGSLGEVNYFGLGLNFGFGWHKKY